MSQRHQVLATLRQMLPELSGQFGVSSLAVFGSLAHGEDAPRSDVDVLVTFRPGARVTLFTLAALALRLEENLQRRVDLIEDHPHLRPAFRAAIEKDLLRVA